MFYERRNKNVPSIPKQFNDTIPLIYVSPEEQFPYKENYGPYVALTETGSVSVNTADINRSNWELHFKSILNIMKDGVESEFLQKRAKIRVNFSDGYKVSLSIFDYFFNLIMWQLIISVGAKIDHTHLFFEKAITKKTIKKYIDTRFLDVYKIKLNEQPGTNPEQIIILLNNIIDECLYQFTNVDTFSFYLANTINLEDDIKLMKQYPEYYELLHSDLSGIPIEEVGSESMRLTNKLINFIMKTDHCLADSFLAEEGVNRKQYREYGIGLAAKPDGQGGIFPHIISKSFINGGVNDVASLFIESHAGRTAQIIAKCNVGTSGHFARILGLNNRDTILHINPKYSCNTKNFQKVYIANDGFLTMFNDRYYRLDPKGMEYKLSANDKHLVGKTLYFRSPMTCASAVRGKGICYKCYGDLAYTNASINIGQLASELLSSDLTQRLLSAKHLLAAAVRALKWNKEFYDYFEVECNIIKLADNVDFKGFKLVLDPDNIFVESEEDNYEYNEYVEEFYIKAPNGYKIKISTADRDAIYISNELNEIIRRKADAAEGNIEIPLEGLTESGLFLIYISNNELSKTLKMVKDIINKQSITETNTRDSILQAFVETIMDGGLDTISVHLEVLLTNQLRNKDNILLKPEWQYPDEEYQLITLDKALTNNPSVTVSMEYQKLAKMLYDPLTFNKTAPSFVDLLFMVKPQDYILNKGLVDPNVKIKSDKDEVVPLVTFEK